MEQTDSEEILKKHPQCKNFLNSDFAIDLPEIFSEMNIFLGQYHSHLLNYFIFTTVTSELA